ncbi:putative folate/pteridine transporter [Trypanosoma cruzi]|uniref:Putative folate/pteridine transporter n=1 Tax=Trypanosoma cruzi TaxID=5693 RepID=A0A2V2WT88_TRYCR|nr:putative folate/pteridine transporter [Trypanosoma cruzi]
MATDDSAPPRIMSAEETVPARSVHIDARALFSALPCLRRAPIFGTSVEAFGPKCVLSMGLSEFLCKGVADFLIRCSLFPMFRRRYGVDAMTYQRMANLASMGWSMKPITAMFSDIFSFFGYTKRWYLAVSCVVGAAFALAFALLPPAKASAAPAAAFVFLTSFTKANVDILTQGHYSRLIRRIPLAGSSLVSWVWWWVLLGSLVASVIAGAPRRRQSGVDRRDRCRHAAVCDDVLLRDELVRGEQEPCKSCRGCQIHARETAGGKEGFQ